VKKLLALGFGLGAVGIGWLAYGALVEAKRLTVERRTLRLPRWPRRLDGYTIAVLADLHVRDAYSVELARRAVELALDENPDIVVLPGDLVGHWMPESPWLLEAVLEPLLLMEGAVIAIPGNHEYWGGDASLLAPILDELNIRYLRNEVYNHAGINWVGIDSLNAQRANPGGPLAVALLEDDPVVVLWHEPDAVDLLPAGADLMIAGHSHGGQWRFPWGWTPMSTRNGEKYVEGFFPEAPTPLYVSRGVGTTGPPARLGVLPEVSILRLVSG
jgi:predicted MPP superfamily phosphohydrolase